MVAIAVLTVVLHLLILLRVTAFFLRARGCHDADKHTVSAIGLLSVLFLAAHAATAASPAARDALHDIPLLVAHNLAVAILMLGQLRAIYVRDTACQTSAKP